ncbi:unnamed protein product [Paramecium pentaurelia]|uniref:Uncharacterized protein n=1 Tax=Paramecium pentaurelia TaxID=43138 RepID=A0A8S1Y2Q4_9CILI|nr:unnamed protein product [Paramecium pentaurelia]
MNSQKEDVLHKLEFKKIIKNSPKNNFEECLNPPSFSESFFLVNSIIQYNDLKEVKQDQLNQFLVENCEKWMETQESTQYLSYQKKQQLRRKLSQFSVLIQILFFMKYMIDFLNVILNLFCGIYIPYLKLIEDYENINNALYSLIFFHLLIIFIQNLYSYIQIFKTSNKQNQQRFNLLNEITLKNLTTISILLIYIIENVSQILLITSFYYFYMGYKRIEIFTILLIIKRRKLYKTLAIYKVIVYYIYFLHIFSCFLENSTYNQDFLQKYKESLIININFITFQANYFVQDSTLKFEVIFNQIIALILILYTIDVLIQIRSNDGYIVNQIQFDVHVLQYYIWNHKGQILKKLKLYQQISNKELSLKQFTQQEIIKKIYQSILKDNLKVLKIFSKQFTINLSQKLKSIRKSKDKLKLDKYGLYLILEGTGYLIFENSLKSQKEIESKQLTFGLINCFQKNISEVELEMEDHFLLLYISSEDFYQSLTINQDFESFHLIKNKIIFEGETNLIDYRCWICNGFHQERRCSILKVQLNFTNKNENNFRSNFIKRYKNRRQRAFKTYRLYKQNESATIDQSNSSSSDSEEQFEIYPDDGSGSQKLTEKNIIVTSKGNIQIPAIQKDGYVEYITDKLYEQLRNSHKNIQLQPSIHTSSQQIAEMFRPDFRSIPLNSSQYKFQELLSVDDFDCVKEYAYFYPEFNISYIISLIQN